MQFQYWLGDNAHVLQAGVCPVCLLRCQVPLVFPLKLVMAVNVPFVIVTGASCITSDLLAPNLRAQCVLHHSLMGVQSEHILHKSCCCKRDLVLRRRLQKSIAHSSTAMRTRVNETGCI